MVLTHEPENANALNALGYTLADRSERLQEAKEYILKAAKLLPDDPAVLDSLGWVYYRLGKYEDAIKWLQKAFVKLQDAEISAHLGEVLWVSGQPEEAKKIWQRGLQVTPDHAILLQTMKRYNQ
jgi:tetratricopeptide (TPR) repeat protein